MNSNSPADPWTTLDALRRQGADQRDPVRFEFIEALARRASRHGGQARHLMETRIAELLRAYGEGQPKGEAPLPRRNAPSVPGTADAAEAGPRALAELVALMSARTARDNDALVEYFRAVWSRLGTDKQLQQSLQQVPRNAGPLNSSHLAHRALSLMRELSPDYLRQFLSYLDALAWMDDFNKAGNPVAKEPVKRGGARKSAKGARGAGH